MNPPPRRFLSLSAVFAATAALAHAHPGHDDGHELTWDFAHIAEYPLATLTCLAVLGVSTWLVWRSLRRASAVADQSLRASQPSRGK